jgi:hypothetical protein
MLSTVSKTSAAAVAGVAVLLAAGCGASGHPAATAPTPLQSIALAVHESGQMRSYRASIDVVASGAVSSHLVGTSLVSLQPGRSVSVDLTTMDVNGQNELRSLGGSLQEIQTSKAVYIKAPLSATKGHPTWAEFSLAAVGKASGVDLGAFLQELQGQNPLAQAELLAGAKDVRVLGTQTVDGVPATHYTGTISLAYAISRIPAAFRSMAAKAAKSAEALGVTGERFSAWIDAQHDIIKVVTSASAPMVNSVSTYQISDINQVSVGAPPANEVVVAPASALDGN